MGSRDVRDQIVALKRRRHNCGWKEVEGVALRAGWVLDRIEGSHATYVKAAFPNVLTIKRGKMGGGLVVRLLNTIESSIESEEEGP